MAQSPARGRRSSNRNATAAAPSPSRRAAASPARSRGRERDRSPRPDSSSRSSRRSSDESQSPSRPSASSRPHTPIRTRSRARAEASARHSDRGDGHLISFAPFSWFSGGASPSKADAAAAAAASGDSRDAAADADMSVLFDRSSARPVRGNFFNGVLLGLAMLSFIMVWSHDASWIASAWPRLAGTGPWYTRAWNFVRGVFSTSTMKELTAGPGAKFFTYSLVAASVLIKVYVFSCTLRAACARSESDRGKKTTGERVMSQIPFFLMVTIAFNLLIATVGLGAGFSLFLIAQRTCMPTSNAPKSLGAHLAAGLFYLAATAVSLAFFACSAREIWHAGFRNALWGEYDKSHLVAACFWDFRFTACALSLAMLQSAAKHGYLPAKLRTRAEVWMAALLSFPIAATGLTLIPSAYYCASELGQAAAMGRRSRAAGRKVH